MPTESKRATTRCPTARAVSTSRTPITSRCSPSCTGCRRPRSNATACSSSDVPVEGISCRWRWSFRTLPSLLGVDLSERQIGRPRDSRHGSGLSNVDLRAMSLTEIDESFRTSTSWLSRRLFVGARRGSREDLRDLLREPRPERARLRQLQHLSGLARAGHGPGAHALSLAEGHGRGRADREGEGLPDRAGRRPDECLQAPTPRYPPKEGELLRGTEEAYVFHDFLEDDNQPTYVHEFLTRAGRHGLEFLAGAKAGAEVRPDGAGAAGHLQMGG